MRSIKLAATTALTGLMLTVMTTANSSVPARECGSDHPQYKYSSTPESNTQVSGTPAGSGAYYNLQPIPLDDETVEKVRHFTDDLDGRWRGTGLDIRCIVAEDNSHVTVSNYDVDAEIDKHFLGSLVMQVQQENTDQVNLDTIHLSPKTELDPSLTTELEFNALGQRTGHRSFTIDVSTPDTLVYDEKYRRFISRNRLDANGKPAAPFAVSLVHEIKTVSINASDLTVSRDVYINGKFVSQQQWQLERL